MTVANTREDDFETAAIAVAGHSLLADRSGALFWPLERALLVADLHLEKGSASAERGSFLPPYDTRTTLGRLSQAIVRYDPAIVVALGDSLHDRRAADRLAPDDLDLLRFLQDGRRWHWISGNHDPVIPEQLGGLRSDELGLGGLTLRHEPRPGPTGREIAAHMHPAAKIVRQGYTIRRPCFVSDGARLVMPAFGAYTGGLNVLDAAFEPIFANPGLRVWMIGHEGVYPVAAGQLKAD